MHLDTHNRTFSLCAYSFLILSLFCTAPAQGALVSEVVAQKAGLTRAWYTQVQVDGSRHELTGARLVGSTLYTLTSAGRIQALDAKTGQTLWSSRVGEPEQPSYGPAAHAGKAALISGSTLYLLDASTGKEILNKRLESAPGSGPVVTEDYVFCPLANGMVQAYSLGAKKYDKWKFSSTGNILSDATAVDDQVVWATTKGILYSAYGNGKGINYRFDVGDRLLSPVTSYEKITIVASANGYVYGLDSRRGTQRWRASIGTDISKPAMAINGLVYVGAMDQTLHVFDAATGKSRWSVAGVDSVVSTTASKVYAIGHQGNLAVIDIKTGDTLSNWPNRGKLMPVQNSQTDRLYFVASDGLVQCFHEIGSDEPTYHNGTPPEVGKEPADTDEPAEEPATDEEFENEFDNSDDSPFEAEDESPFGDDSFDDGEPADDDFEESEEDDPFGDDPFGDDDGGFGSDDDDPFAG